MSDGDKRTQRKTARNEVGPFTLPSDSKGQVLSPVKSLKGQILEAEALEWVFGNAGQILSTQT